MSGFFNFSDFRNEESNRGVSAVIGVLILIVLTLLLVSGVYFTATNLTSNNPEDLTAGTTTERVSPYEYQTTLVTNGNANHIQVVSPLGTKYNLTEVGDSSKILAVQYNSNSQVNRLQITASSSNGDSAQRQLLKSKTVDNGISPDLIVDKYGTGDYKSIQTAIDNAPSATADNTAVIVVEKATYTENIDVSQNITLIAEHGTIIEDAEPNEPVVHIKGDDSQVRNFQINGDPQANDDHYASHGVLIDGANAQVVGNSLSNAQSPDLKSAGISIDSKNSFVQYNNFKDNQRSISLQSNAESPLVCGNQLSNSIGGFVSDQTKRDLAMNNYWENGIPSNLIPDKVSNEVSSSELTQKQSLSAVSSRVPTSLLPTNSRAGQPFPGTQLSSDSEGASIEGCDVNVNFVNTGLTFSLSDIRVLINGGTPLAVYESSNQPSSSGKELANEQGETIAVCSCGGDGSYDGGDVITVYQPSSSSSSSSSDAVDSSTTDSGVSFPQNPATDTEYTVVEKTGSDESPSYTPVNETAVEEVSSVSQPEGTDSESSTDDEESSDLGVELGEKITAEVGEELVLTPVLNGTTDNVSYQWHFDDGETASTQQVKHIYTNTGTYNVSLTVSQDNIRESETDSVLIEIQESSSGSEFETVSSTAELQSIVTDTSSTGSGTVYLSSGTYSITEVSNPNLEIVGTESGVVFENRVSVTSAGVTFRDVTLQDGLSVSKGDFKLYGSDVSSDDSYSVEVSTSESNVYIGSSSITGTQNGLFVAARSNVVMKKNTIDVSGNRAVSLGARMDTVELTDNTLKASEYGVYVGHATTATIDQNSITAQDDVYEVPNKKPEIKSISVDTTLANVQSVFDASVSDPQGDSIQNVEWSVDGVTQTLANGASFDYLFDSTGGYTVEVTVTDEFGASTTQTKTVTITQPTVSVSTQSPLSVGNEVSASVETNIIDTKIKTIKFDWGTGDTTTSNTYTYSNTGSYTVTASVATETGRKFTATSSVDIVDSPIARFDYSDVLINKPVSFNASDSSSPNNADLTYQWTIDSPSISEVVKTGETMSYSFPDFGSYTVKLKTIESDGVSDSTTKTVSVNDMDVSFTVDNPGVNIDSTLSASTSGGSLVDKYKVDWDGDGSFDGTYYSSAISHSFTNTGQRAITVKAIDTKSGASSSVSKEVQIYSSPSFTLYAETTQGYLSNDYTFEARNVDADSPSYDWSFGNGDSKTGKSVTQSYNEIGVYTVEIVVENKYGITRKKSVDVTIESPSPYAGCTKFTSDTTFTAGKYTYDCVVVTAGTTITAKGDPSQDSSNSYGGVKIKANGPIVVNGTINADGQGYQSGGPGATSDDAAGYGGEGCYIYDGGYTPECSFYSQYGTADKANRLGSGEYYPYTSQSAAGGGSVWLDSEESVYIKGLVTADGKGNRVAGSGGSIRIEAPETKGDGALSVEGGFSSEFAVFDVAGGGGRILIKSPNRLYQWNLYVNPGAGWSHEDGSIRETS